MNQTPLKVAVTGAAGQICYSLLFRIASGALAGDRPIELRLLEITPALPRLEGVVMELDDCAFDNVVNIEIGDDPRKVFDGVNAAMLVGSMPRKAGMDRSDLLSANGKIFTGQGKALNDVAADDVHVLVTGNPANTNALIAMNNAPDIPNRQFSALTRLDHNRAKTQLAKKLGVPVSEVKKMTVWGNHSNTQYPDVFHAEVAGAPVGDKIEQSWLENEFIPTVSKRGGAIIEARGASSAASAAHATVECMHAWLFGTPENDWVSMSVVSEGQYGIPEGLIYSMPVTCSNGDYKVIEGLEINDFSRAKLDASAAELEEERKTVTELGLI